MYIGYHGHLMNMQIAPPTRHSCLKVVEGSEDGKDSRDSKGGFNNFSRKPNSSS